MPAPNSTALALVSAQPEEVAEAAIREGENTTTPQPDLPPLDPEAFTPTSLAALDVPSTKEEACAHSWRTTFQVALHSEGSPRTIYRALREGHKKESWSLLRGPSGERFASFKEFCETPVPHGLGRPIDVVERFLFGELGVASELGSRPIVVGRIEDLSMKPSIREASMIQTIRHANVKLRAEQLDKLHIIKMRLSRERQERLTLDDVLREAADMYVRYHEAAGNIAHEGDPVSAAGGCAMSISYLIDIPLRAPRTEHKAILDALRAETNPYNRVTVVGKTWDFDPAALGIWMQREVGLCDPICHPDDAGNDDATILPGNVIERRLVAQLVQAVRRVSPRALLEADPRLLRFDFADWQVFPRSFERPDHFEQAATGTGGAL